MRITALETLRIGEHPNLLWVRAHTDEGLVGLGETWFGVAAVEADIHERIAALVLGEDPARLEHLNRRCLAFNAGAQGALQNARSRRYRKIAARGRVGGGIIGNIQLACVPAPPS